MPKPKQDLIDFLKFADTLAALGAEPRLRIVYHLLRAHPQGLVAGALQAELGMQPSAVSHHLEKLKHENLVRVKREGTFLRYTANPDVLQELLGFLSSQCCADSSQASCGPFQLCQPPPKSERRKPAKDTK